MRLSLACALFACAAAAAAHTPPPALTSLVGHNDAGGTLLIIKDMTAEQRAFIWRDTERGPDGYLRVQNSPDYLQLVAGFRSDAGKPARAGMARLRPGCALPRGLVYGGAIPEDQNRTTLVFNSADGGAALTVWNFRQAGAKVTVIDEVLNQVVDGARGTLALNVAKGHKNALWKLTWWKNGIGYELYVPDALGRDGLPARRSKQLVALAATLANQLVIIK